MRRPASREDAARLRLYISRLLIGTVFLAVAFALGFATNIVEPGKWHQNHAVYYQQVDAYFHGRFAIGHDPARLKMDMAWHDGAVQQIWGLGVPLLMVPTHLVSKLLPGGAPFPERVFFLLLLAGLGFAIGYALRPILRAWQAIAAGLAVMLFPPFVSLLLSRFQIWEEAVAYEYLTLGYLTAALISLAVRPTGGKFVLLYALAGFVPFVRPTAVIYSFAAAIMGLLLFERKKFGRAKLGGLAVAVTFAIMLLVTNAIRFGAPLEFGHAIHTNIFTLIDYTTTFENPFRAATFFSAAKDFIGSFVFTDIPSWKGFYEPRIFAWQSPTFRWHEFYFRVYDVSYLALLAISAGILGRMLWRRRRSAPFDPLSRLVVTLLAWSLLSVVGLFGFYLEFFGMSSRFLIDFAPALFTAFLGTILFLGRMFAVSGAAGKKIALAGVALGCLWFGTQLRLVSRPNTRIATDTAKVVSRESFRQTLAALERPSTIPTRYVVSEDPRATNIPFNGVGWEHRTGETAPYAVFFIKAPQSIRVVFDTEGGPPRSAYQAVAAKVGLEYLKRIGETTDGRYLTLEFGRPTNPRYQTGIQMLSLKTVEPHVLSHLPESGLALMEVNWNP